MEAVQSISMFHNGLLNDKNMVIRIQKVSKGSDNLPEDLRGIGVSLGGGENNSHNISK
jgi:hypothetical protein